MSLETKKHLPNPPTKLKLSTIKRMNAEIFSINATVN